MLPNADNGCNAPEYFRKECYRRADVRYKIIVELNRVCGISSAQNGGLSSVFGRQHLLVKLKCDCKMFGQDKCSGRKEVGVGYRKKSIIK